MIQLSIFLLTTPGGKLKKKKKKTWKPNTHKCENRESNHGIICYSLFIHAIRENTNGLGFHHPVDMNTASVRIKATDLVSHTGRICHVWYNV